MSGPNPSPSAARILDGYAAWVAAHDTLTEDDCAAIAAHMRALPFQPTISLLLPLGFGVKDGAAATLASVQAQLYPRWQLYVIGTSDADEDAIEAAAARDRRIVRLRHSFADLAEAGNAAFAAAAGPFVALLNPGERLPEHALYEIAVALGTHPETELLYTDEDTMDWAGARSAPRLKTGWDPDLLLAEDYIGGLAVWRLETVLAAGGLRPGFGRAAAYDLALRATASMLPDRIRHVPAVLLHRPPEAARDLRGHMLDEQNAAARRAVCERLGGAARIEPAPLWPSANRVIWTLPDPLPLVSVIVPTRDRAELLRACVRGVLERTDYPALEVLILDNDSREPATAGVLQELAVDARVRVLRHPGRFNYAAINNAAVEQARGDIVVLLNNDVEVIHQGWLREMVSHAVRPDVGAVGAKLLYGDGTLQHGGIVFGPGLAATHVLRRVSRVDPGYNGQLAVTRTMLAVTGACMALRRRVFREAGGLNAERFAVAFNDLDLCLRLGELGYRIVFTPFAELFHLESASRGLPDTPEKVAQELRETENLWYGWRHVFTGDPFHNINLSCDWQEPLHLCAPRRRKPWQMES
jgi:GT2 family glycosyltransferase